MLMISTNLRRFRTELTGPKVSQEAIARQAGLSLQWYRLLEKGRQEKTSYTTARNILAAINAERQTRGQKTLSLDDLGLTIV